MLPKEASGCQRLEECVCVFSYWNKRLLMFSPSPSSEGLSFLWAATLPLFTNELPTSTDFEGGVTFCSLQGIDLTIVFLYSTDLNMCTGSQT